MHDNLQSKREEWNPADFRHISRDIAQEREKQGLIVHALHTAYSRFLAVTVLIMITIIIISVGHLGPRGWRSAKPRSPLFWLTSPG